MDEETLKRIEQVADNRWLKGKDREDFIQSTYKQVINSVVNNTQLQERETQINNMCYEAAVSWNKGKEVASRVSTLAQQVKKKYPEYRNAKDDDNEVVQWFVGALMDEWYGNANQDYCSYIESWNPTIFSKYKLTNPETKDTGRMLKTAGIWLWTLWVTAGLLAWPTEKLWNIMYQNSMPKTMKDSRAEIDELASTRQKKIDIKNQKNVVKEAEKALDEANKVWEWVKEAQTALDEAKAWLKEIQERWIKEADTTMDTWLEFNIRGWIKKMAAQAKVAKDKVWKDEIKNVIDNSTQRINVLDITNKFVSDNAYKWLNGKIQKETAAALKNIQKYYGRNSDLWSVSLADLQDLKSSIMTQLEDAYTAIANGERASLTTEEKLLEKYANTLKNALQEAMQKETDTNVAKSFKKRADLDRIYWEWIKTNAKKEAGKISDNIATRATQQLRSRGGWTLSKVGWWIKNLRNKGLEAAKWLAKDSKTILRNLGKGWVKALAKKWIKWLLDPVALVMPTLNDIQDENIWVRYKDITQYIDWTQSKLDKKRYEWVDMRSLAAQLYNDVKENKEIKHNTILDRKTTPREILEEMWIDPDERLAEVEKYLNDTNNSWWR